MKQWLTLTCVVFVIISGCQKPEPPIGKGMVIAKGTVTFKGTPLDPGQISFIPIETKATYVPNGEYVAALSRGRFEIEISPGTYRVEIVQFGNEDQNGKVPQLLPKQYNSASELTAEVSETGKNELSFSLK